MRAGQRILCVEKPGWLTGISRGKEYICLGTSCHAGHRYLQILGDDNQGHILLASMFRIKKASSHGKR